MGNEPGLRERKRLELREHLSTTAVGLFVSRGFDEVSVAEVAEAAGVSKMTVFNHFPTKEGLVMERARARDLPDLAGAVHGRAEGEAPFDAMLRVARQQFSDQAARGDDDSTAAFVRMVFRSTTLQQAFARRWTLVQQDLAVALAQALGTPLPPEGLEARFFDAIRGDVDPGALGLWMDAIDERALIPHLAAGQVVSTLQQLTMANLVRRVAGLSNAEATERTLAELEPAFELLRTGLGDLAN